MAAKKRKANGNSKVIFHKGKTLGRFRSPERRHKKNIRRKPPAFGG